MCIIRIKTNIFSQSSKFLKNGTIGPDGITPESVRNAFGRFIIEAIKSNANDRVSAYAELRISSIKL